MIIDMYINIKELSHLESQINKLQYIIEKQAEEQNRYFPESIHEARKEAKEAEEIIKKITEREIKSKANKIIKQHDSSRKKG